MTYYWSTYSISSMLHNESLPFTKYMRKKETRDFDSHVMSFGVSYSLKFTKWEKEKRNAVLFVRCLVKATYQADLGPLNQLVEF